MGQIAFKIVLTLFMQIGFAQANENYQGPISTADSLTQARLMVYFINEGLIGSGADIEAILEHTDDDYVQSTLLEMKGQMVAQVIVWSGENPHGALFVPGTSLRIGTHSDGSNYLMTPEGEIAVPEEDIIELP